MTIFACAKSEVAAARASLGRPALPKVIGRRGWGELVGMNDPKGEIGQLSAIGTLWGAASGSLDVPFDQQVRGSQGDKCNRLSLRASTDDVSVLCHKFTMILLRSTSMPGLAWQSRPSWC